MLLIALSTTLLAFLASAATLRFLFSRQRWFWVLPFILSLLFLYLSLEPLHIVSTTILSGSYQVRLGPYRSVREIVPLIILFLWYMMIIIWRYALKQVISENKQLLQTKKNVQEAHYIEQLEVRNYEKKRKKKERAALRLYQEQGGNRYPLSWLNLMDSSDTPPFVANGGGHKP